MSLPSHLHKLFPVYKVDLPRKPAFYGINSFTVPTYDVSNFANFKHSRAPELVQIVTIYIAHP